MKRIVLLATVLVASFVGGAFAQDYPTRPVRVIVPNPVGGATDAAARLYQRVMEQDLPQPMVIVNMPGAGTATGSRNVVEAAPDGHTMLVIHQALYTSSVMGLTDYGPEAFTPVALTGLEPTVLVVHTDSDFHDLDDLFTAAREDPTNVKAGVQIGALNHFAIAMVAAEGDVDFNYVQTGGGGPSYAALLGGHIDLAYGSIPDVAQYIEAGQMRVVAVLMDERVPSIPDAPTAAEQGYDVVMPIRHVWYMPSGSPDHAVTYMENALTAAIHSEAVTELYASRSVEPVILTGEELKEQIAAEFAAFHEAGKDIAQ